MPHAHTHEKHLQTRICVVISPLCNSFLSMKMVLMIGKEISVASLVAARPPQPALCTVHCSVHCPSSHHSLLSDCVPILVHPNLASSPRLASAPELSDGGAVALTTAVSGSVAAAVVWSVVRPGQHHKLQNHEHHWKG